MKKTTKRIGAIVLVFALMLSLVPLPVQAAASPTLTKKATIYLGKTQTLKVYNTKSKVTWKSSNKSVATVSSKGVVTAKKGGKATITAKVGKKSLKCTITVPKPEIRNTKDLNLKRGDKKKISPSISNSGSVKYKFSYSSSDSKIVSIDKSGNLVAKTFGIATITVKATAKKYETVSKSFKVSVEVPTIKITNAPSNAKIGYTKKLSVSYYNTGTYKKEVTNWKSSDPSVISVDKDGVITILKNGSATISCNLKENANVKTSVTITVSSETNFILTSTDDSFIDDEGVYTASVARGSNKLRISAKLTGYYKNSVTWSTSNNNVSIKTTSTSCTVTGLTKGTCVITAKAANNDVRKITVTVKDSYIKNVYLNGKNIEDINFLSLSVGDTKKATISWEGSFEENTAGTTRAYVSKGAEYISIIPAEDDNTFEIEGIKATNKGYYAEITFVISTESEEKIVKMLFTVTSSDW